MNRIPTYVVVCDEIPDRKAAAQQHLRDRGVRHIVWNGVHGRSWCLQTTAEYDKDKHISAGHVGLCLSVWNLWNAILTFTDGNENDPLVIFEDDVKLPENYDEELQKVSQELASDVEDWDLCFLGLAETEPAVWGKVTERIGSSASRLCRLSWPFGTHAMLLRRRALPILLKHMNVAQRNLDQQLYERVLKPGYLKWCAVLPSIVTQRTFDYVGAGKPEWGPSCVDVEYKKLPEQAPAVAQVADPLQQGDTPGRPDPDRMAATLALVDQFSCMYRGEALEDDGIGPRQQAIPLSQCGYLNTACHTRVGVRVRTHDGKVAASCDVCNYRKEMSMQQEHERPRLPLPEGHFNPSILKFKDRLILATRDSWGHSKVALWELINTRYDWTGEWSVKAISSLASDHPEAPRLEDPRLYINPSGNLSCVFSMPDGYPPKLVQVGHCEFADDLQSITKTEVFKSPFDSAYEKNWTPFIAEGNQTYWVYGMKPSHTVIGPDGTIRRSHNPFPWTGGVMRGGAAPVLHKGRYYSFFHGCLKSTKGNIYSTGCYTFSPGPPFRILKQTPVPLIWPDLPGPGESVVKRYVVFVGGAVFHEGAWFLSIGVDDSFSRIVRIPEKEVEAALSDKHETQADKTTSIRSTSIALGIKQEEFK